jgi:putative oxidoreductase
MSTSSITNEDAGKTAAEVLLWLLQLATAVLFFMAAYPKLVGSPAMVALFETIGFGQWFRYLTGVLETVGGILLMIPGYTRFGALLLIAVMLGAVLTHFTVLGDSPVHAAEYLGLSLMIAWFRRDQAWRR